jgi:hypothetical protein
MGSTANNRHFHHRKKHENARAWNVWNHLRSIICHYTYIPARDVINMSVIPLFSTLIGKDIVMAIYICNFPGPGWLSNRASDLELCSVVLIPVGWYLQYLYWRDPALNRVVAAIYIPMIATPTYTHRCVIFWCCRGKYVAN